MAREKGLTFYRRKKKINPKIFREITGWLAGLLIAVFVGVVSCYFFGMTTKNVGVSMEDYLYNGQTVYINRFAFLLAKPSRGDIVAFLPNGNENSHYYVKRVVAVPGDKILVKDGVFYVNGIPTEWIEDKILQGGIAENELTLKAGEYFCLGDNVNSSEDSRSANIGTVNIKDIVGRVWFKLKNPENEKSRTGFLTRHIKKTV